MKKRMIKIAACLMTGSITFGGTGLVSMASGVGVPLAGLQAKVQNQEEKEQSTEVKDAEVPEELVVDDSAVKAGASQNIDNSTVNLNTAGTQETKSKSDVKNELAISQVNDDAYVNIRDKADLDGAVVGKIYNNSAATILSQEGDWYYIQSGSVEGYVSKEFFATGSEAEELAKEVGWEIATVNAEALMVRSDTSTESDPVDMAVDSDTLWVEENLGDWLKIVSPSNVEGYVAKDYVTCETQFNVAESKEEEEARIASEEAAYWASVEAAKKVEEAIAQAAADQASADQAAADQAAADAKAQADQAAADQAAADQAAADAKAAADQAAADQAAADQAAADANGQADDQTSADQAAADQAVADQAAADAKAAADAAAQAAADAQAKADADAQAAADAKAAADAAQQEQEQQQQDGESQDGQDQNQDNQDQEQDSQDQNQDNQGDASQNQGQFGDSSGGTTPSGTPESSTSSELRQSVVNFALQFQGYPYVWGGTSLTNGADCSGFTQSVLANFGIYIARVAADQANGGRAVALSDVQPGDLLFYEGGGEIGHVSMYIGNNQIIHASNESTGIIVSDMSYMQACSARSYID